MFKFGKITKVVAVLAVVSPLALVGCKGRGHGMSPERIEKMEKKVAKKLDLTPEQKVKLSAITSEVKKIMSEKKGNRLEDLEFAKTQIASSQFNIADVRSQLTKKQDEHLAVYDRLAPKLQDFHASLSAEQKNELVEFLEKFKERFQSKE
jgi:Spy/CpxP family protein refolding chaperone